MKRDDKKPPRTRPRAALFVFRSTFDRACILSVCAGPTRPPSTLAHVRRRHVRNRPGPHILFVCTCSLHQVKVQSTRAHRYHVGSSCELATCRRCDSRTSLYNITMRHHAISLTSNPHTTAHAWHACARLASRAVRCLRFVEVVGKVQTHLSCVRAIVRSTAVRLKYGTLQRSTHRPASSRVESC